MPVTDMRAEMAAAHEEVQRVLADAAASPDVLATEDWTVHQVAAHLVAGVDCYAQLVTGQPSPVQAPADLAAFNAAGFARCADDDVKGVAHRLHTAVEAYLQRIGGLPPDMPVPYHFGWNLPVHVLTAILVNELLLHGQDVACATGLPFRPPEPVTAAALAAFVRRLPRRFIPAAAPAVFDLRLCIADQPGVICHVADGALEVLDDGDRPVDCTVTGPALAQMCWLNGRERLVDGALTFEGAQPAAGRAFTNAITNF